MAKTKKEKVEFDEAVHGTELSKLVEDSSDLLLQAEAYQDRVKENRDRAVAELGIEAKQFNALLKLYHKDTRERFEDEQTQLVELYDSVFPKK